MNPESWFWCDTCHCPSYSYGCECGGTSCNATGCEKCRHLWEPVREIIRSGKAPSEAECKANNFKKWGSVETPERKLLRKYLGL